MRFSSWSAIGCSMIALMTGFTSPAQAVICITVAAPVTFGVYNPVSPQDTTGVGLITVTCTLIGLESPDVAFSIGLSRGSGSVSQRKMVSAGGSLNYNLYTDVDRTAIWGDGSGGGSLISDALRATGLGTIRTYTVYGRIPARQATATTGIYTDPIVVTIAY